MFFILVLSVSSAFSSNDWSLDTDEGEHYSPGQPLAQDLLLVFMSFKCNSCIKALPKLSEINRHAATKNKLVGIVFHTTAQDMAVKSKAYNIDFPLAAGTEQLARYFAVTSTPTLLWVNRDWQLNGIYLGAKMIGQLASCFSAAGDRCHGLGELTTDFDEYAGKQIVTGGVLTLESERYYLSDFKNKIAVTPWLPLNVAPKATKNELPRMAERQGKTMQSLVGKIVTVEGLVEAGPIINVKKAFLQEDSLK